MRYPILGQLYRKDKIYCPMSATPNYPTILIPSAFTTVLLIFFLSYQTGTAQDGSDTIQNVKEYRSLEEALIEPEKVLRLNLSNQKINIPDSVWSRFSNLEYLSLKNDRLKQLPTGIGNLRKLKVLDLSGNDFVTIPNSYSNLIYLQELYLNDDRNFILKKSIPLLSRLPRLNSLHLENDHLLGLPKNFAKLVQLDSLYLNDNEFKQIPQEVYRLKNLKYLDVHNNKLKLHNENNPHRNENRNSGFIIKF